MIVGLGIQLQRFFHRRHERPVDRRDQPMLLLPRLGVVFLERGEPSHHKSSRPCRVPPDDPPTVASSSRCAPRAGRCTPAPPGTPPAGGQACEPPLEEDARSRPAPGPPPQNRRRVRSTMEAPTCRAPAISASVCPSSANSRMCPRFSLRAPTFPARIRANIFDSSASVRPTTYFFSIRSSSSWKQANGADRKLRKMPRNVNVKVAHR